MAILLSTLNGNWSKVKAKNADWWFGAGIKMEITRRLGLSRYVTAIKDFLTTTVKSLEPHIAVIYDLVLNFV